MKNTTPEEIMSSDYTQAAALLCFMAALYGIAWTVSPQ